jgi:hypothetical protein
MVLESTCRCTNDYYCFICSWAGKFSVVVGVVLKSWDTYCVELNNLRNENERKSSDSAESTRDLARLQLCTCT